MTRHLIFLSIPGLRARDVRDKRSTPTLNGLASAGALAEITPSFPCVTSPVQASMWTGVGPGDHGVIANGFYDRQRHRVDFWVGRNGVVRGEQVWDVLAATGELRSAVWHAQNIKDAAADFIVTPEPIHEPDGTTKLWCYSKPEGLYARLLGELGHFPLHHYWGPLSNIESSRWIIRAAQCLIEKHDPNFHFIYLPHLDYAAQKHGPDSPQAAAAVRELDGLLAGLVEFVRAGRSGTDAVFLAVSEYTMTDVRGVVYPNVELRRAGLLTTREGPDGEVIDMANSRAFAMVDHQCAHVYCRPDAIEAAAAVFRKTEGVERVYVGDDRSRVGLRHERAGEIVLSARSDHWFAYYWWEKDEHAPGFARTVDIHRKPGYDPVELFIDPATRSIPLDAALVKGSHGAPVASEHQRGALICSAQTPLVESGRSYRDTDVKSMVLGLLGVGAT